jgi:hypothetical protein
VCLVGGDVTLLPAQTHYCPLSHCWRALGYPKRGRYVHHTFLDGYFLSSQVGWESVRQVFGGCGVGGGITNLHRPTSLPILNRRLIIELPEIIANDVIGGLSQPITRGTFQQGSRTSALHSWAAAVHSTSSPFLVVHGKCD